MTGRSGSFWPDTYLASLSGARKAESDLWRSLRQWSSKSGLWPKGIGWDTTWQTYANLSYDSHMIHETMWIYYDLPRGNDPICAILRTIQSLEGLRFVPDLEVHWWSLMIWFELPFFYCDKPEDFPDHSLPLIPRVYLSYLIYVSFFLSSFSILDFHYMWICPGEPSQALAKDIVTFLQAVVQEWETITDSKLESFLNFHS